MAQARKTTRKPATRKTPARDVAVKRSVLRVLLLSIISGGLYGLYWFYVTRQAVTAEIKGDDQVGLQTAGLLVPILNVFIIYWLLRDIDILHRKAGLSGFPALWFVLGPLIGAFIPFVNIFVGIASIVLYGLVIMYLNQYWDKSTGGKATNAKVTGGEIAISIAGLVINVILFFTILVGALFANNVSDKIKDSGVIEQTGGGRASAEQIYNQVQSGMTKQQVEAIAGTTGGSCTTSENDYTGAIESCFYNGVSVTFQDGKVTSKTNY
jgi:hypothetical protein